MNRRPPAPSPLPNPPCIRWEGYGPNVQAAIRRAAMRGLRIADPADRRIIRAMLREAQLRDLREQILGWTAQHEEPTSGDYNPGGDAAS